MFIFLNVLLTTIISSHSARDFQFYKAEITKTNNLPVDEYKINKFQDLLFEVLQESELNSANVEELCNDIYKTKLVHRGFSKLFENFQTLQKELLKLKSADEQLAIKKVFEFFTSFKAFQDAPFFLQKLSDAPIGVLQGSIEFRENAKYMLMSLLLDGAPIPDPFEAIKNIALEPLVEAETPQPETPLLNALQNASFGRRLVYWSIAMATIVAAHMAIILLFQRKSSVRS